MAPERAYDIVLFGATGFTGELTAEYLANHLPDGARWALAGRNMTKLEAVRSRLAASVAPERAGAVAELPLLRADSGEAASLRAVADATRVLISTVGPYLKYGEPLVAACAEAGTTYLDLTGEPEFVDQMYLRYHAKAVETGSRLVHACGFDSIPYDLGVLYTVLQLPEGVPIAVQGFVRAGGTVSGGTYHSAVNAMSRLRQSAHVAKMRRAAEKQAAADGGAVGSGGTGGDRRVKGVSRPPHSDPLAPGWVVSVPTIDPQIVLRSARALDRYGPDFSYAHYIVTGKLVNTAALAGGIGALATLAQLKPTRDLLLRWKGPGDGPSPEQRAKSWFKVKLVADAAGTRLVTQVSGGDPGYGETAKMLAESAMCLAFDDLPAVSGQLTPAVAMGQPLIDRLQASGIRFEVRS
jgi:short subunit dehydrogenase-like uncharacterized protein